MENDIVLKHFCEIDYRELGNKLPIITIYYDTKDYPKKYVARLFNPFNRVDAKTIIPKPTPYVTLAESLQDINNTIPEEMHFLTRNVEDDDTIIGSWI